MKHQVSIPLNHIKVVWSNMSCIFFSFYFSTVLYDIIHKHLIKNQFLYRMTKNYLLYFYSFCIFFLEKKIDIDEPLFYGGGLEGPNEKIKKSYLFGQIIICSDKLTICSDEIAISSPE